MTEEIDLAEWIKANPGVTFTVDNDCWYVMDPNDIDNEDAESVLDDTMVARKGDGGYGSGHTYGGDILQALAEIVGVKIESV